MSLPEALIALDAHVRKADAACRAVAPFVHEHPELIELHRAWAESYQFPLDCNVQSAPEIYSVVEKLEEIVAVLKPDQLQHFWNKESME